MTTETRQVVVNFVLFQLGWLACVLGGAQGWALWGALFSLLIVLRHLQCAQDMRKETHLLLLAGAIGLIWESALVNAGLLIYPNPIAELAGIALAPYWILTLWLIFATTFNVSMRWLKTRLWLAVPFGAIGGPLAFVAGEKLGAVIIPEPQTTLVVLAIGWAIWSPLLAWASRYWDGFASERDASARLNPANAHG
jgi:hypothetical protein